MIVLRQADRFDTRLCRRRTYIRHSQRPGKLSHRVGAVIEEHDHIAIRDRRDRHAGIFFQNYRCDKLVGDTTQK